MAASDNQILAQMQRWTVAARTAELSDALLLARYSQQNEESAFAALVARHGAPVWRVCHRILGNVQEAEDAFQAVFLILSRKAASLKQPEALPGWLHGVARRVALKARTKAAVRAGNALFAKELTDPRPDPLTQLTAREFLDIVDEEIARLPAAQRSAVILCCLEGHAREEAARILGCTDGSIKGHLQRGRQRLQKRLQRRGVEMSAALGLLAASHGEAVSVLFVQTTVKAVLSGGIGNSAVLAHAVLKTMFAGKLAGAMAVVLTVALAASTTVALVYRGSTAEAPEDRTPAVPAAPKHAGAGEPKPRTDALGDPLPDGAIARLGSPRFRHADLIFKLAFTSNGRCLVSQGWDGVRFWDAATGKELRHIAPKAGHIWDGSDLSADGKWLAGRNVLLGGNVPTRLIELWSAESGKKISEIGEGYCTGARFSPDSKLAGISHAGGKLSIWDLHSRKKLRSWTAHSMQVSSFAFSADSRKLLSSGTPGDIRLWDVATGRQLQEYKLLDRKPGVINGPESMALSPDGETLAVIEANEKQVSVSGKVELQARISLRDTSTGKQVGLLRCTTKENSLGFAPPFSELLFHRDGKKLLTGGPDRFLREWDVATGKELRRIASPARPTKYLALSPDEKHLAATTLGSPSILFVDLANGRVREAAPGHWAAVSLATLTPDGRTAVTANFEGSAFVWDVATGTVRRCFDDHKQAIISLQLASDGRTAFSSDYDGNLRVWDIESGKQLREIRVDRDPRNTGFNGPKISRDGKTVAFIDRNQIIRVIDAGTGKERQHYRAPIFLHSLAIASDSGSLVGWAGDHRVHAWDLMTGAKQYEYRLPLTTGGQAPRPVAGISQRSDYPALWSDGRLFAISTHWQLIVKDLTTPQDVHRYHNLPFEANVLAFSPNGKILAYSCTSDTAIHFLEVASGRERCRLLGYRGQVTALNFSARSDRLIAGCSDTTALVWDLVGNRDRRVAADAELEALWSDLGGKDAARAYRAILRFAASPSFAVSFIRKHLHPVAAVDEKRLVRLIADLDSDDFTVREKATAEVERLDEQALPAFRKALEGNLPAETRRRLQDLVDKAHRAWWSVSGERLRSLRAIEALELAGTKEAGEVLQTLAAGAEGARLTKEASAARQRLANSRR